MSDLSNITLADDTPERVLNLLGEVKTVSQAELLSLLENQDSDLILIRHQNQDSQVLIEKVREKYPAIPMVVYSESPTLELVTACLRAGVGDFLTDLDNQQLWWGTIERLLPLRKRADEHEWLKHHVERRHGLDDLIGTSSPMTKVFDTIERVADLDVDVLILGETGTGKELVAQAIHKRSKRSERPFVPVDCGAIPENLLESEFFGHERGAFTGADSRRIGLLEYAHTGTLFLDEVGELPLLLQAKLLRTLQERKIRRVGGREEIPVDLRILAATARNLEEMVRQKQFREDLYYRINVVSIHLPPLRERGDDLGLLAELFAMRYSREMGRPVAGISPEAYQVLSHYRWPGNIRELQNVIRRAIALSSDSLIGVDDLMDEVITQARSNESSSQGGGFFELRDRTVLKFERDYLKQLLGSHRGNVKTAALEAQVPRGTLYRLMKNHGLESAEFR